jgi:hypoxanthine phosphoribosyltransferase
MDVPASAPRRIAAIAAGGAASAGAMNFSYRKKECKAYEISFWGITATADQEMDIR